MYNLDKVSKYAIITDGRDVIHNIHNTEETVTTTGQPFMITGDTEAEVNDLFYNSWKYVDDQGNVVTDSDDPYKTLQGTPSEITWHVNHPSYDEAMGMNNAVMSVAPFIHTQPIKHPNREEYANPVQQKVLGSIPDGEVKTQLIQTLTNDAEHILTREQMEADGWF